MDASSTFVVIIKYLQVHIGPKLQGEQFIDTAGVYKYSSPSVAT